MDPQEIDSALDELENRLDRLRSLYEQYFMGIEKIEPTVPRKDVDRRFWILRRTPIRNTARRFRLQTLTQRYNTFQQHWTRICREIENGTYVRHLLKAQKNLGAEPKTWAAKKRLGLLRRDHTDSTAPAADTNRPSASPPSAGAPAAWSPPAAAVRGGSLPPPAAASSSPMPAAPRTARPADPNLAPLDLDLDDAPTLPPPPGGFRPAAKPVAPAVPGTLSRPSPIPLPGARARPASAIPRPPAVPSGSALNPPSSGASPRIATVPVAATAASRAGLPSPPRPNLSRPPAAPGAPAVPANRPTTEVAAAAARRHAALSVRPATAPAAPGAGQVGTRPAAGSPVARQVATPAAPGPGAKPPAAPGTAAPPVANHPGAPVGPVGARPLVSPKATPAAPVASGAMAPGATALSDERVRQLHADLSSARQKLNQASSISVDSLAKSLRETEAKLRAQHGGRSVDFQIVIKDGKPIVKPVVRR